MLFFLAACLDILSLLWVGDAKSILRTQCGFFHRNDFQSSFRWEMNVHIYNNGKLNESYRMEHHDEVCLG